MRSLSSFIPAPNLAQAFGSGIAQVQQDEQLAANIKMKREEMANQYAMAEMEAATKRQALAQQAMMQNQELDVEKQIKLQQLGLQERELQGEQMKIDEIINAGAQQYQARQAMRGVVEEQLSAGKTPGESLSRAGALYGTDAGAAPSMMGDIIQSGPGGVKAPLGPPVAIPVLNEDGTPTGQKVYKASQGSYARLPESSADATTAKPTPGMEGRRVSIGNKTFESPAYTDLRKLEKSRDELSKRLESDTFEIERRAYAKSKDEDAKLTPSQERSAKKYAEELARLDKMSADIAAGYTKLRSGAGSTNQAPRRRIWNSKTRRLEYAD